MLILLLKGEVWVAMQINTTKGKWYKKKLNPYTLKITCKWTTEGELRKLLCLLSGLKREALSLQRLEGFITSGYVYWKDDEEEEENQNHKVWWENIAAKKDELWRDD